jgi:hypothetical protein
VYNIKCVHEGYSLLVFSALANNKVYKITHFQFRVGLANKEYKDLSLFRHLLRDNSPMSSNLILMETSFTKGEQSARLVRL